MKITSQAEYATRLMVALARVWGAATLTADKLSEGENVPVDYVNQILLRLRRAGLVESRRGTSGGYSLARDPGLVSVGQVMRAVDGAIFEDVCRKYEGGESDLQETIRFVALMVDRIRTISEIRLNEFSTHHWDWVSIYARKQGNLIK